MQVFHWTSDWMPLLPFCPHWAFLLYCDLSPRQCGKIKDSEVPTSLDPWPIKIGEELAEVIQMGGTWIRYVGMYQ